MRAKLKLPMKKKAAPVDKPDPVREAIDRLEAAIGSTSPLNAKVAEAIAELRRLTK